ncbi:MAG: hypothetical protein K2I42_02015 [Anaeroplasmataceae bacterium]|nr:hypothetical protein [Anaeroplasmataceae bacterium]
MEFLDNNEKDDKLEQIKTRFEDRVKKQFNLSKKIILAIFLPIGLLFLLLGVIFLLTSTESAENEFGIMFIIFGGVFLLIAILFYLFLPKTFKYEDYLKRKGKYYSNFYYAYNIFELDVKVELLEEQNMMLNHKIEQLESRLEEYRKRN